MKKNQKLTIEAKPKQLQEWREYEKGSLLENGLALNSTATFIWKAIDGKTELRDIAKSLSKTFGIDYKKAEEDLLACVTILYEEGGVSI